MPNTRRGDIKQKFDGWIERVGKTRDELIDMAAVFREHHADYADQMMHVANGCDMISKAIEQIKDRI